MNYYCFSWDIRDANPNTLRINMVALLLSIDSAVEQDLTQPLLSCLRFSSEKDYDSWITALDNADLGKYVFFTFTQVAEDEEKIFYGEVANTELQESLMNVIERAKDLNNKVRIRRILTKELDKLR